MDEGTTVSMWFYISSLPTDATYDLNLYKYTYPFTVRTYF